MHVRLYWRELARTVPYVRFWFSHAPLTGIGKVTEAGTGAVAAGAGAVAGAHKGKGKCSLDCYIITRTSSSSCQLQQTLVLLQAHTRAQTSEQRHTRISATCLISAAVVVVLIPLLLVIVPVLELVTVPVLLPVTVLVQLLAPLTHLGS